MKKFAEIFTGLCWTAFILCVAVILALNMSFLYKSAIRKNNLTEASGLTEDEILENYYLLVDYNNLGGPDELEFPDFSMSESGRTHFAEVRDIFHGIEVAAIVFGVLVLALTLFMNKLQWYKYRLWGSMITLILPLAVGILLLFTWDSFFVKFHEIVFRNDYWIFDASVDPVITVLPESFFRNSAFFVIEVAVVGAVLLASSYRRTRPLSPEEQAYVDEKAKVMEARQKEYEEREEKRRELKKGKRFGKHDFNLSEKANRKLKDMDR